MEMQRRLYEAAIEGNVTTLKALIQEDPLILDRLLLTHETPLHVSVLRGHLDFTRGLLSHNPKLATESDSLGRLPLHLAAAKGHLEIARELLRVGPGACVACEACDKDGMPPLHVAVVKGVRAEVVRELTRASPESTRLRVGREETVYHLCVKFNNLEGLKVLVEELVGESDNTNLFNARDDYGNTLFHLAALHKNLEMMKYLLSKSRMELNTMNKNGHTALDLVENAPRDMKGLEIMNLILASNPSSLPPKKQASRPNNNNNNNPRWKTFLSFNGTNLEKFRGELLLISAIVVLITVLPIINMKVSGPVLEHEYTVNTLCLVPAMAIMVLLVSGLSLGNKFCVWLVLQLFYTEIGFLGLNYINAILSNESRMGNVNVTLVLICIWFGLLVMVSLLNTIRFLVLIVSSISGCVKRRTNLDTIGKDFSSIV